MSASSRSDARARRERRFRRARRHFCHEHGETREDQSVGIGQPLRAAVSGGSLPEYGNPGAAAIHDIELMSVIPVA